MKTLTLTAAALILTTSLANALTGDLSGLTPNLTFPEPLSPTVDVPVQRDLVRFGE
jgi:uncharacterized membrane protein